MSTLKHQTGGESADRGYAKGRSFSGGHFISFLAQALDESVEVLSGRLDGWDGKAG
jgi:hypothetical protein